MINAYVPHARPFIVSTTACGFKWRTHRSVVARLDWPNLLLDHVHGRPFVRPTIGVRVEQSVRMGALFDTSLSGEPDSNLARFAGCH
jgi:hypothetical protein